MRFTIIAAVFFLPFLDSPDSSCLFRWAVAVFVFCLPSSIAFFTFQALGGWRCLPIFGLLSGLFLTAFRFCCMRVRMVLSMISVYLLAGLRHSRHDINMQPTYPPNHKQRRLIRCHQVRKTSRLNNRKIRTTGSCMHGMGSNNHTTLSVQLLKSRSVCASPSPSLLGGGPGSSPPHSTSTPSVDLVSAEQMQAFTARLDHDNLTIGIAAPDGNCFFHSLIYVLRSVPTTDAHSSLDHVGLRAVLSRHIDPVSNEVDDLGTALVEHAMPRHGETSEQHTTRSSQLGVPVGSPFCQAFADVFDVRLLVHHPNVSTPYIFDPPSSVSPLHTVNIALVTSEAPSPNIPSSGILNHYVPLTSSHRHLATLAPSESLAIPAKCWEDRLSEPVNDVRKLILHLSHVEKLSQWG